MQDPRGRTIRPCQANNAYVFPAIGYGSVLAEATHIPDESFLVAAETLASLVTDAELEEGALFPSFANVSNVSADIAAAVAEHAVESGFGRAPSAGLPRGGWCVLLEWTPPRCMDRHRPAVGAQTDSRALRRPRSVAGLCLCGRICSTRRLSTPRGCRRGRDSRATEPPADDVGAAENVTCCGRKHRLLSIVQIMFAQCMYIHTHRRSRHVSTYVRTRPSTTRLISRGPLRVDEGWVTSRAACRETETHTPS